MPRRTETQRRKRAKRRLRKHGLVLVRPDTRERAGKAGSR
jgi:hypothetical protein